MHWPRTFVALLALAARGLAVAPSRRDAALLPSRGVQPLRARLFCYSVVHPAELPLIQAQQELGSGIFGCDHWVIFGNGTQLEGIAPERIVHAINGSMETPHGGEYGSALNTDLFLQVWRRVPAVVAATGTSFDWVIKLDADSCFSAARMRNLARRSAPHVSPTTDPFVWAVDGTGRWVPGPIEAYSYAGMLAVASELEVCAKATDTGQVGEDIFMMSCINGDYFADHHRVVDVLRDVNLLCWDVIYCSEQIDRSKMVAFHPTKTAEALRTCVHTDMASADWHITCRATPECATALTSPAGDAGNEATCSARVALALGAAQLTEADACDRVAGEFPKACGACGRPAVNAARGARLKGSQVVLFRTTSALMVQPSARANAVAMHTQLGGTMRILVDTTICGGLACNTSWLAASLGMPSTSVWGYTACDLAERWPAVPWPLFGIDQKHGTPLHDYKGPELRCWLLTKAEQESREAGSIAWPVGGVDDNNNNNNGTSPMRYALNGCSRTGDAIGMVPYLVHEPSLVLWYRAHEAALSKVKHVWVVEEDALYGGSLNAFLASHEHVSADLITVFCPFSDVAGTCVDPPGRTTNLPNDTRVVGNRAVDTPDAVHQWEHVVRFSTSLVDALEKSLDKGEVRHGEEFAPTLCAVNQSDWCTTFDLRESLSASRYVGTEKLAEAPLPHSGRWYHTEEPHRCEMLMEWAAYRGDAAMIRRIAEQCHQPTAGNAMSVVGFDSKALMRPVARLVRRFDCGECCRGGGELDWCCPGRNATGAMTASGHL